MTEFSSAEGTVEPLHKDCLELRRYDSGVEIRPSSVDDHEPEPELPKNQNGDGNPVLHRYASKDSGVGDMEESLKSQLGSFGQEQKFGDIVEESVQDPVKPKGKYWYIYLRSCVLRLKDKRLFSAITSRKPRVAPDGDLDNAGCQETILMGFATDNLEVCKVSRIQTDDATSESFPLYTLNVEKKICQAVIHVTEEPYELMMKLALYASGIRGEIFHLEDNPGQLQSEKVPAVIACQITAGDYMKPTLAAYPLTEFPDRKKEFEAKQPGNLVIVDITIYRSIAKQYYGVAMYYQLKIPGCWYVYYLRPSGQDNVTLVPVKIQGTHPDPSEYLLWSDTQPHGS